MFYFFFQAEDGIRDLVRSRGLGDVYKRQPLYRPGRRAGCATSTCAEANEVSVVCPMLLNDGPVSYTHLTLPTSDLV